MQERDRLEGLDLAWLLAVVGIMALPIVFATDLWDAEAGTTVLRLLDGPPVVLFAILFGIELARRALPRLAARDRAGAVRAALGRGLWTAMLGVVLGTLGALMAGASTYGTLLGAWLPIPGILVWAPPLEGSGDLLVPLGIALAVAAPLVLLPGWALALAGALLAVLLGPLTALVLQQPGDTALPFAGIDMFLEAGADTLLSGPYPALWLLLLVVIGMLALRVQVRASRSGRERLGWLLIAVVGAAVAAAGLAIGPALALLAPGVPQPFLDAVTLPFTGFSVQSPGDALWAVGLALTAVGALGLLGSVLPSAALRTLAPLRAAGAAPLTLLVLHLVLSALLGGFAPAATELAHGWGSAAVQVAAMLAVGAVLAATGQRGPLDAFVSGRAEALGGLSRGAVPLDVVLPDDTSLEYSRTYPATVDQVWRAITDPAHVIRWISDPAVPLRSCAMDVRPGGTFRYEFGSLLQRAAITGHYPRVDAPSLLVTQVHLPGGERPPYATVDRLEALGERTLHHVRDVFATRADRDAALQRVPYTAASLERLARHLEQGIGTRAG